MRQPVRQSVHPSWCRVSPGIRDKFLFLCIGKYYIVLGHSILFMHLVYISLDEGLTQDNRRKGRKQTYCHTASGILNFLAAVGSTHTRLRSLRGRQLQGIQLKTEPGPTASLMALNFLI
jgi:hypothetical protein